MGDIAHSRVARSLVDGLTAMNVPTIRFTTPENMLSNEWQPEGINVFNDIN